MSRIFQVMNKQTQMKSSIMFCNLLKRHETLTHANINTKSSVLFFFTKKKLLFAEKSGIDLAKNFQICILHERHLI